MASNDLTRNDYAVELAKHRAHQAADRRGRQADPDALFGWYKTSGPPAGTSKEAEAAGRWVAFPQGRDPRVPADQPARANPFPLVMADGVPRGLRSALREVREFYGRRTRRDHAGVFRLQWMEERLVPVFTKAVALADDALNVFPSGDLGREYRAAYRQAVDAIAAETERLATADRADAKAARLAALKEAEDATTAAAAAETRLAEATARAREARASLT